MQELIEYLEKYKEVIGMTAVMIIDKAKSLLPAERKMVEDEMEREAVGILEYMRIKAGLTHGWPFINELLTSKDVYELYKESQIPEVPDNG